MAKDGTNRAVPDRRVEKEAARGQIQSGTLSGTLVMQDDLPGLRPSEGGMVLPSRGYLKAKQKNGSDLCAEEIFRETWLWLNGEAVKC